MTGLKPPTLNVEIAGKIVELYIFGSVKYTFDTFNIVEIRNFTQLRQKILWYNSRIPALAINELLSTSRR